MIRIFRSRENFNLILLTGGVTEYGADAVQLLAVEYITAGKIQRAYSGLAKLNSLQLKTTNFLTYIPIFTPTSYQKEATQSQPLHRWQATVIGESLGSETPLDMADVPTVRWGIVGEHNLRLLSQYETY